MNANLKIQTVSYDDCTIGRLFAGDFQCFTLELPWLNNAPNISCVSGGIYPARKHKSPSLGDVIHILDVDGRTWIYIHNGNFTRQIQGCILVGRSLTFIDGDSVPDVSNSSSAFNELFDSLPDEFTVEIERAFL